MDKFKESLRIALANLTANTIRSMLSILGIVIGIAAVVTILAVSAGARADVIERINTLGVNMITVYPHYDEKTKRIGKLVQTDVAILNQLPSVLSALPRLNSILDIRSREAAVRGTVRGIDVNYIKTRNLIMTQGRNFSPIESEQRRKVCLVRERSLSKLFPKGEPLGQTLHIRGLPWEVIGVYKSKVQRKSRRRRRRSRNLEVLVPLTTLLRTETDTNIDALEVMVRPNFESQAKDEINAALERDDPKRKGLFRVWSQQEYIQQRLQIDKMLSLVVVLVGSISLLVGGIGMMNVMLTSVAERTREIGIRRAVGARKRDILFQFLVESAVLSSLGGVLGLLLGTAIARFVPILFHEIFKAPPPKSSLCFFSFLLAARPFWASFSASIRPSKPPASPPPKPSALSRDSFVIK